MSKNKNNGVDPNGIIEQFGADTARMFMMFTAPPEQTLEWSEEGVQGSFRFIRRLWKAVYDQVNAPPPRDAITTNEFDKTKLNAEQKEMRRIAHHTLEKVTDDIGRRRSFNTAVAAVMELLNAISKFDSKPLAGRVVAHEALEIAVMCLSPMIPHVTHELWHQLGHETALINETLVGAGSGCAGAGQHRDLGAGQRQDARACEHPRQMPRRTSPSRPRMTDANVQKFVEGKPITQGDLRARQAGQHRRMKRVAATLLFAALARFRLRLSPAGPPAAAEAIRVHLHRHQGRADRLRAGPAQGADRLWLESDPHAGFLGRDHQRARG